MKLRWLHTKYPAPSLADIREYRDKHCCGIEEAKKALKKPDTKILQIWNSASTGLGYWVDVPIDTVEGL